MVERGLLLSPTMVRAERAGWKTHTRRVVTLPHENPLGTWEPMAWGGPNGGMKPDGRTLPAQMALGHSRTGDVITCPLGQPGERLWVREAWRTGPWYDHMPPREIPNVATIVHEADAMSRLALGRYRHARFMCRWMSRTLLEITEIRVERLQDISEADAIAEGIEPAYVDAARRQRWRMYPHTDGVPGEEVVTYVGPAHTSSPIESYQSLWLSINGPGSWRANPFVWVIVFKRIEE